MSEQPTDRLKAGIKTGLKTGLGERGECRHCGRVLCVRARGLCSGCYQRVQVRVLYPMRRRRRDGTLEELEMSPIALSMKLALRTTYCAPLPARSTTARPGTPEKIEVMVGRAKRGEQLFHPLDSGWGTREEVEEMQLLLRLFGSHGGYDEPHPHHQEDVRRKLK